MHFKTAAFGEGTMKLWGCPYIYNGQVVWPNLYLTAWWCCEPTWLLSSIIYRPEHIYRAYIYRPDVTFIDLNSPTLWSLLIANFLADFTSHWMTKVGSINYIGSHSGSHTHTRTRTRTHTHSHTCNIIIHTIYRYMYTCVYVTSFAKTHYLHLHTLWHRTVLIVNR